MQRIALLDGMSSKQKVVKPRHLLNSVGVISENYCSICTLTQLMSHWDTVLDGLEHGSGVDCVYLDFSKAFDKVETGVLLHKLKDAKILGKTGRWLAAFLHSTQRQQAVGVEGTISPLSPVISGVPQGRLSFFPRLSADLNKSA